MIRIETVQAKTAKTHLTQLLARVAKGEQILITNRGELVAMLVQPPVENRGDISGLVEEMLRNRDKNGPTLGKKLTSCQLKMEGRR